MNISALIKESHETAVEKGWWEGEKKLIVCKCAQLFPVSLKLQGKSECEICKGMGFIEEFTTRSFGDQIALMHSELSEALEEFRDHEFRDMIYIQGRLRIVEEIESLVHYHASKPEGIAVELADLLIRVFDTCGRYNIPLEEALKLKMAYNKTRPHRHGGKVL